MQKFFDDVKKDKISFFLPELKKVDKPFGSLSDTSSANIFE